MVWEVRTDDSMNNRKEWISQRIYSVWSWQAGVPMIRAELDLFLEFRIGQILWIDVV
jgi:hypothetical protein